MKKASSATKKGFSATEFLKRSIEFEEQQAEEQPKIPHPIQAKEKIASTEERVRIAPKRQGSTTEEIPPKIDDLKISKSFYKVPNTVDDLVTPTLSAAEEVIYRRLIRLSWGWGKNYCRAGIRYFQQTSGIKSRTTIKTAIDSLLDRKIIYRHVDKDGQTDRNQNGTIYIVPVPGVPENSAPNIGIPENDTPGETTNRRKSKTGGTNTSIPENGILDTGIPKNDAMGVSNTSIPKNSTPDANEVKTTVQGGVPKNGIPENNPIKDISKDSLKDTLSSRAIISGFYEGIGQKKIAAQKRERAENSLEELLNDGFTPVDIQFAVKWTLANAKEELYDFSIIKHTIGQAIAAKGKVEAGVARKLQEEKIAAQEQADEKKREEEKAKIDSYKETLNSEERTRLRERAEAEIRESGQYKTEFITEHLIEAKESELIRGQIDI